MSRHHNIAEEQKIPSNVLPIEVTKHNVAFGG